MVSALVAMAALAAIGLLFALDPGGAIVESGFPDFREMQWGQLTAWVFRTVGLVAAQLIIIALWLWPKYRNPQATASQLPSWIPATPQSGSLPAAAVSVLEGRMTWGPTFLASIIEMCQRGTLRMEAVGTRDGFLYRLSKQGPPQYGWERTICDSLPWGATTIDVLHERIGKREEAIGDQIGAYLQHRGFFHDNPVRVRRENPYDSAGWGILAAVLMGVGSGFWAVLWLTQWWWNALIGGSMGIAYSLMATLVPTGMLTPTQTGAYEIRQWLDLKESLAGSIGSDSREQSDSMLAHAVALNVAQPWLSFRDSAPPWFGSGEDSSPRGHDLDAAYHGFLHAPEWNLIGRSDDVAEAAAEHGYEVEPELKESESQSSQWDSLPETPRVTHQDHQARRQTGKKRGGGCFCGCIVWVVSLVVIGALAMVVLFSLDVVSPREKPCPLDSSGIPPPGLLSAAGGLYQDECVRVRGEVVFQDMDELLVEIDRGEYVQRVSVRGPDGIFEGVSPGGELVVAGRLKVEENGSYAVHFEPDSGLDRGWWRNLRENFEGFF